MLFCVCVRTARFCFNWRAIRNLTDQAYSWAYEVAMYDKDMSDFQFESRPEMCKSDRNIAYTSKDWPLGIPVTAQVRAFALFVFCMCTCAVRIYAKASCDSGTSGSTKSPARWSCLACEVTADGLAYSTKNLRTARDFTSR